VRATAYAETATRFMPRLVEGGVMSIPLLYVLRGYHLFHYGEAQAASCRFWDSCKGHADAHA
jgi:hypothetical protein